MTPHADHPTPDQLTAHGDADRATPTIDFHAPAKHAVPAATSTLQPRLTVHLLPQRSMPVTASLPGRLPRSAAVAAAQSRRHTPQRPVPGSRRGSGKSVTRWSEDWEWWRARSASFDAVASWQERHACLAGAQSPQDVLEACGADKTIPMELADRRLAAVVAEAVTGDAIAARLALQRVFPGLVTRAGHRASMHRRPLDGVLEELMASAWLVITEFPLNRRPVKIAVNITRDAEYRLFGYVPVIARNTILMPAEELPESPLPVASTSSSFDCDPQDRLGEVPQMLLDAVDDGFPVDDARLLAQLFIFDLTVAEIAVAEGVSTRWIRMRRTSAIERFTAHIGSPPPDGAAFGGECA